MIKTKKDWDESGKTLTKYLSEGDQVDEDMVDYFLGVVPPIFKKGILQIGEAYSTNRIGDFTYMTLKKKNGEWHYIGAISTVDAIKF